MSDENGIVALGLFPYPTMLDGQWIDGSLFSWPRVCTDCHRKPCQAPTRNESIETCPYGMNYVWLESEVMIGGVVLTDLPTSTTAHRRRRRTETNLVSQTHLAGAWRRLLALHAQSQSQFSKFQAEQRTAYERSRTFKQEILAEIRSNLDRSLAQAHDYLGLLRQIRQHIQAVLERHFPGVPPEEAAESLPNEGAIFFASELMWEKLDATKYLRNPALVSGPGRTFTLHRALTKYIRIYRGWAIQRKIDLIATGESFGTVRYNPEPIGAAFQALLDNALKYSPPASEVRIVFVETPTTITVTLHSLGPRIELSEADSIFREGFRAAGAIAIEETGMGLGLAIAKLVSDELQLDLGVDQDPTEDPRSPRYYPTRFSLRFNRSG